jgi:hypothetical protein
MGRGAVLAITDLQLDDPAELVEVFGPWEQIFCGEFDGRLRKRVLIKITRGIDAEPATWAWTLASTSYRGTFQGVLLFSGC